MKTEKVNNTEKGKAKVREKKISPKKEAWGIMLIGLALFIGFSLLFILFYRPFVPWKKIVCSEEDGTYIVLNDSDVKYIYEIDGVVYEKILKNVPYDGKDTYGKSERNIIYVNIKNPTDVKHGSRGGGFFIFVNWTFIVVGGYMTGWGIYKFHRIKIQKKN